MIDQQEIDSIANYVSEQGLSEDVLVALRKQYPGKHFTWCMDDDINSDHPVVQREDFAIYLVDSSDHCSKLTSDPASASGYVLAEILA